MRFEKMMKYSALAAVLLFSASAFAQQADPVFLQHALESVQAQRNQANDQIAAFNAQMIMTKADLTKAQARIKELEDKYEPKKAAEKK